MSPSASPLLPMAYAALAPWLALALLLTGRNPYPSRIRVAGSLALSFLLLRIPICGWDGFAWARTLEANPSLTLTLLLALLLAARTTGRDLLGPSGWKSARLFGIAAALILYPMGLGLTQIDPYAWGWGPWLPGVVTLLALLLLLMGNRFGLLLAATLPAWLARVQESRNFWDLLIDPVYAAAALLSGIWLLIGGWRRFRTSKPPMNDIGTTLQRSVDSPLG